MRLIDLVEHVGDLRAVRSRGRAGPKLDARHPHHYLVVIISPLSRVTAAAALLVLEPSRYLFRFAIAEDELDDYRLIVHHTDYPVCD
jgi:hypothetical protein